ncbi:spore coat protein U-like protein [Luteibacter sp. OK325]|uniref:Csu type fimbrial protein n=1 Tax=Luteibacter sp. OK325 TaxID=2135670 RepID=UPI000D3A91F8|nr:spore coat U domain-containing protein [Luteibacter sp. OK325]PTR27353.1 spore coat protein U-like protein [Luteibacter sp. OK325]
MKWLALLFMTLAALCGAPRAQATTTCTVTSITNVAFGTVDPTGTFVDTTATLNYSCTYNGLLGALFGTYVTACASLGADDLGSLSPRTMIDPSGDRMQYQLYKDSTHTTAWGTIANATYTARTFNMTIGILSNGAAVSGNLTIYGRVPALQSNLSPGSYAATLASSLTSNALTYSYNEALLSIGVAPATCQSGGTGGPITVAASSVGVTASVAAKCTVGTATDLDFGSVPGLLKTATDKTSLVRMTCTNRAAYQVGLDDGQNASGGTRRMSSGTGFVSYDLYRDSQRTLHWGSTLNTDTATGTGSGSEQTMTVYGRVPAQAAVKAATYSDIIMVTVTY